MNFTELIDSNIGSLDGALTEEYCYYLYQSIDYTSVTFLERIYGLEDYNKSISLSALVAAALNQNGTSSEAKEFAELLYESLETEEDHKMGAMIRTILNSIEAYNK